MTDVADVRARGGVIDDGAEALNWWLVSFGYGSVGEGHWFVEGSCDSLDIELTMAYAAGRERGGVHVLKGFKVGNMSYITM